MKERIQSRLNSKIHSLHDINREILYKNRLTKSLYFILLLVAACTMNVFMIYFTLTEVISINIVDKIFDLFIFTSLIIGFFVLPYHPKHYGFNLNRLKENLIFGIIIGIVLFCGAISFRIYMVSKGALEFKFDTDIARFLRDLLYYPINSLAQEALFRGSMQSFFIAVLEKAKTNKLLSIMIPSLIFAQFHILYGGILVFLGAFVLSMLLGLFYERTRSLVGVTIIHFFAGAGLFFFSSAIK